MTEQIIDLFSLDCECSICLENIIGVSNKVVTECGHTFHCKCLMTNITFNGFGCPFCRNAMAVLQDYSDSDSYSGPDTIIVDTDDDDDDDDDDESDDDSDSEDESDENSYVEHRNNNDVNNEYAVDSLRRENNYIVPESGLIIKILQERGYTMEDMIKLHLFLEHSRWGTYYQDYENVSRNLFSLVLEIIEEYNEPPSVADFEHIMPADPTY
jgi:hypothetical protein